MILSGDAEQENPLIRYELPYLFDVVTKLPRTRAQAEDGNAVDDTISRPPKVRKIAHMHMHAGYGGDAVSQSAGPSGQGPFSSGDSRGPTKGTLSGTSELTVLPANIYHPPSPAEASMPPRQPVIAANNEGTTDGRDPVLEGINPSRGPIAGGIEVWLEGSGFPIGLTPLYARFGDNFSRVVSALLVPFGH